VKLTLTYRGPLPSKRRGVTDTKRALRHAFHPQIRDQVEPLIPADIKPKLHSPVGEFVFLAPVHRQLRTAVELDVLMLVPQQATTAGDVDNRLKTLVDGLTRPANLQQLEEACDPADAAQPTYCLMDDDGLVQRLSVDARPWFDSTASTNEALVIVTATIVLGSNPSLETPMATTLLVL
jgi:hypothetical protein